MGKQTPQEKALIEARYAQVVEQMPVDFVSGISVDSAGGAGVTSPWIDKMKKLSTELSENAWTYANYTPKAPNPFGPKKKTYTSKKIISAEGFPPDVTVSYASPSPFSYAPWYGNGQNGKPADRQVKFFILHSFGHFWNSEKMKSAGNLFPITPPKDTITIEYANRTVYIAGKNSDPTTLANFDRFANGLRTCLGPTSQATAHFFIDRIGNLVVVGDCQDIMYTSNQFNDLQLGVELEEAFYVLDLPTKKSPASGKIKYFFYGPKQLFTLSILIAKLQLVYPDLVTRQVYFDKDTAVSPKSMEPGYLMHDAIAKQTLHHFDLAPNFKSMDFWNKLFDLVDAQKAALSVPQVFKVPYQAVPSTPIITEATKGANSTMGVIATAGAKATSLGQDRADAMVGTTKSAINSTASNAANNNAQAANQRIAGAMAALVATNPPTVDLPSLDVPVDADGNQVGTSDAY